MDPSLFFSSIPTIFSFLYLKNNKTKHFVLHRILLFIFKTERTERLVSSPESASEGEREIGDATGDEVDSFDDYIEDDDNDPTDGTSLYHSLNFLTPSRSRSRAGTCSSRLSAADDVVLDTARGTKPLLSPEKQNAYSSPQDIPSMTEERKREIEERALAVGEARIIACQALWRRALCMSRFRILGTRTSAPEWHVQLMASHFHLWMKSK